MTDILAEIATFKRLEIQKFPEPFEKIPHAERDFAAAIKNTGLFPKLIAEIKPASPVKGRILPENVDIGTLAANFERGGAAAISVLTDEKYFGGSFENLQLAKQATKVVPIFCKDFIVSKKQIMRARSFGADSFLLIAKILSADKIQQFLNFGRKYGMEAMVEIADELDLQKVKKTDAKIIGINNRDLRDFSVDITRTFQLRKQLSRDVTVVSLSGFSGSDVRLVKQMVSAVLVGAALGKAADPARKIREYLAPSLLVKTCGVRTEAAIIVAETAGANLIGFNFVPSSKRHISLKTAVNLRKTLKQAIPVGVFQNQSPSFVRQCCEKSRMTFAQLSGDERAEEFNDFPFPIIKGIRMSSDKNIAQEIIDWEAIADIFLFDGTHPGSGEPFSTKLLPKTSKPFLVAGGVNPETVEQIISATKPDGIDSASGIENAAGEWDVEKIWKLREAADTFNPPPL